MTETVTRAHWLDARRALLDEEKRLTSARDAVSQMRRSMPVLRIDKTYQFSGDAGLLSLGDLFEGKSQLVVYHFMFGADWEAGCKMCSFWADSFNFAPAHLAARDTAFVVVSSAPLEKLTKFKSWMDWRFRWVSAEGRDFNRDFGVSFDESGGVDHGYNYTGRPAGPEMPGMTVFKRLSDGGIGMTYAVFGRGLDPINVTYQILDLTPAGRDEAELEFPMSWVRRRNEYDTAE